MSKKKTTKNNNNAINPLANGLDVGGATPLLIDNTSDSNVLDALKIELKKSETLDVATGTFEVGSLMALDGIWQKISEIRLIMGDDTSKTTKITLVDALKNVVNDFPK
jgi:hypothetical protein